MTSLRHSPRISGREEDYKHMVAEMSELDPRELAAIFGLRPRDIPEYCEKAVENPHRGGPLYNRASADRAAPGFFIRLFTNFAAVGRSG